MFGVRGTTTCSPNPGASSTGKWDASGGGIFHGVIEQVGDGCWRNFRIADSPPNRRHERFS